jgi:predicted PurR-regulated permease PerM
MQTLDMASLVSNIFPGASTQFLSQLSVALSTIISKLSSSVLNYLINAFLNIPTLLIDVLVICFVFFFTLRDSERLKEFVKAMSPLSASREKMLIKYFEDVTYSIIYGVVVVGVIQGLLAGLGFLIFGVENALVLTVLAIFFAVLPIAGPFFVWIPIAIYMFSLGNTAVAIAFLLYNLIIVSGADNVLRVYILSKRTNLSPVFALISAIGGLFLFGVIGLILGPLIFAYFIILLDMYREKNLLSLFMHEEDGKKKESK